MVKGREIKLSLVYRDMWQSFGRSFPTIDQLKAVAPAIIGMGCFDRVETNGGAFEQVCLLSGKNPNRAVREWTASFRKAGIQTQMLERGLSALGMNPVPADVRDLMYKVKRAQGTDVARSFCGLNDHRNLKLSVEYARNAGMISQVALAIVNSPLHTLEHYMSFVGHVVEYGCDEICLKDMAGTGHPAFMAELTRMIKKRYPHIPVHYHGHCGPDFSLDSMLGIARAGADWLDVAVSPLAWGKGHPEVLAVHQMLKSDGFTVKEINKDAYGEVVALTHEFIDLSSGCGEVSCDSGMTRIVAGSSLPGGMIGSMLSDMKDFHAALNEQLHAKGKEGLTADRLVVMLLQEVEYIWPMLGYPPLVTPFSQYVKNTALMNIMNMLNGRPRWTTIDKDTWNMLLGKMGRLPGQPAPEIMEIARAKGLELYMDIPQDAVPDELDRYRAMMNDEGWDCGQDDEELFELAIHERQYRSYRKGLIV